MVMRVECFLPHSSFWEILVQDFGVLGGGLGLGLGVMSD